jgi:hypothetical protein
MADAQGAGLAKPNKDGRRWRPLLLVVLLFGIALLLVGWHRVASSPSLCSTCHDMRSAVESASRSVHADVPCLACHTRPGLMGSLRYAPTFAREGVAELTGWDVAHGVLDPAACNACHSDLWTSPTLKTAHPKGTADCESCHGEVSHPPLPLVAARPTPVPSGAAHPQGYTQTHGEDAVSDPGSCNTCHQPRFCQSCHFKSTFPHPEGWISTHGQEQQEQGPDACTLCHATTFCVGCHGTEIPHKATWLGEHWRALQDAPVTPCLLCHPKTDCSTCHAKHDVHISQDLYAEEPS